MKQVISFSSAPQTVIRVLEKLGLHTQICKHNLRLMACMLYRLSF